MLYVINAQFVQCRQTLITSAEEGVYVFGVVCLSVCLSVGLLANLWTDFDEIFGGVGHGSRTKWYNFGGDPDHASDPGVQSPKSGSSGSAEVCAVWASSYCERLGWSQSSLLSSSRHPGISSQTDRCVSRDLSTARISDMNCDKPPATKRIDRTQAINYSATVCSFPDIFHWNTAKHYENDLATHGGDVKDEQGCLTPPLSRLIFIIGLLAKTRLLSADFRQVVPLHLCYKADDNKLNTYLGQNEDQVYAKSHIVGLICLGVLKISAVKRRCLVYDSPCTMQCIFPRILINYRWPWINN